MSETKIMSATSIPLAASATRKRSLFLSARSQEPCGVEMFTRTLVAALAAQDRDAAY
jgi:hypothetical protein